MLQTTTNWIWTAGDDLDIDSEMKSVTPQEEDKQLKAESSSEPRKATSPVERFKSSTPTPGPLSEDDLTGLSGGTEQTQAKAKTWKFDVRFRTSTTSFGLKVQRSSGRWLFKVKSHLTH